MMVIRSWGNRARRWRVLRIAGGLTTVALTFAAASAAADPAFASPGWAVQQAPASQIGDGQLSAGSCTAISACTAVGTYTNGGGTPVTLSEFWNGTSWAVQPTPNPAGATSSGLTGVWCTSTSDCTAVGTYTNSVGAPMTWPSWNGTSWIRQTTPNPTGATSSELSDVACTTPSACTAVGYYTFTSGVATLTLAERWNGTRWAIQSTTNPGGVGNGFNGVSCTSTSACTAVGEVTMRKCIDGIFCMFTANTMAEAWNGTGWNILPTPNPTGATSSNLTGVSCTSTSACTAVGTYTNSGGAIVTLAEFWDGTSWAIQPTPNPTGATSSSTTGASCTASAPTRTRSRSTEKTFGSLTG